MNNQIKNTILVLSISLLGGLFFANQAQANGLSLDVIEKCNFQYGGDSCLAELKLTNNAGEILDGTASLHINYQGACSNNKLENFDGEGIKAQFSVNNVDWLNFSNWNTGTTTVSGFEIAKGETQPKLKIETVPNLCPGEYTFSLELKGTTEKEEYIAPPVVIGGGGGVYIPVSTIKGDINGDNKVDKYDFSLMMSNWGKTGTNSSDLNNDRKVDKYDFALLMLNWSK